MRKYCLMLYGFNHLGEDLNICVKFWIFRFLTCAKVYFFLKWPALGNLVIFSKLYFFTSLNLLNRLSRILLLRLGGREGGIKGKHIKNVLAHSISIYIYFLIFHFISMVFICSQNMHLLENMNTCPAKKFPWNSAL